MKKLKEKDRIWIPYNVAYEYHQNRLNVIRDQNQVYKNINDAIDTTKKTFISEMENCHRHSFINIDEIRNIIDECISDIKNKLDEAKKNQPNFRDDDTILETLNNLFKNSIGEQFEEAKYKEIIEEGKRRYKKEIPPGYKDKKEKDDRDCYDLLDERKFGDLIIWKQIIEKAKTHTEKQPIILVIDDAKSDWWWEISRGDTWGPRPELIKEIQSEAGILFYMYRTNSFFKVFQ